MSLEQLRMAMQVQSAMASAGLTSPGPKMPAVGMAAFTSGDPFGACFPSHEVLAENEETNEAAATFQQAADEIQNMKLRLFAHSGRELPRQASYVVIEITSGTAAPRTFKSEIHPASTTPVWEFSVDEELEVNPSSPPVVDVHVYGHHLLGGHLVGAASVPVFTGASGPQRKVLNLKGTMPFSGSSGKVLMIWQLSQPKEIGVDLGRIAQMDDSAMELCKYRFDIKPISMTLRKAMREAANVYVKMELVKKGLNKPVKCVHTAEAKLKVEPDPPKNITDRGLFSLRSEEEKDEINRRRFAYAEWEEKWQSKSQDEVLSSMPWETTETLLCLLCYHFKATVYKVVGADGNKDDDVCLGCFEDNVYEMYQSIDASEKKLWFNGTFRSALGNPVGDIQLEVDVFVDSPHRSLKEASEKKKANSSSEPFGLLTRPGINIQKVAARKMTYFVSVWADCLNLGLKPTNPYVTIQMGVGASGRGSTSVTTGNYDVRYMESVKLHAKADEQTARVQIWNRSTSLVGGHDALIGQYTIYNVAPNVPYWCHCFGGAVGEGVRPDQALEMTKHGCRPPSTYRGTVVVSFSSKPRVTIDQFEKLTRLRKMVTLKVRLYRGLYLDSYAGCDVNVVIQLPGARLSTDNPCVLSFPGTVNADGVLSFNADKPVRSDSVVEWVERQTPKSEAIYLCEGIQHAYMYIVRVGEEERPPQTFGRVRLTNVATSDTPRPVRPAWKRIRYDNSVTELPAAFYKDFLAGFILGSAVCIEQEHAKGVSWEDAELNNSPSSSRDMLKKAEIVSSTVRIPKAVVPTSLLCRPCTGERPVRVGCIGENILHSERLKSEVKTIFCHMDVLCARSLQSMDPDGLLDPCFAVRVEDKMLIHAAPDDCVKSLDPAFLDRIILPFKGFAESAPNRPKALSSEQPVPLPPVLLRMLDRDPSVVGEFVESGLQRLKSFASLSGIVDYGLAATSSLMAELTPIGTIAVKNALIVDDEVLDSDLIPLNDLHVATWYSLDKNSSTAFDSTIGGVDPSWKQRPRVLLATLFSLKSKVESFNGKKSSKIKEIGNGYLLKIESPKNARFVVTIDLLGIRNLPESTHFPELTIFSFWEGGAVRVRMEDERNPNFYPHTEAEDLEDFRAAVAPILRIQGAGAAANAPTGDEAMDIWSGLGGVGSALKRVATAGVGKLGLTSSVVLDARRVGPSQDETSDTDSLTDSVQLDDFIGVRIIAPEYIVPVLNYLQTKRSERINYKHSVGIDVPIDRNTYVLMPDLVLKLENYLTGKDYGSLSISLPMEGLENTAEQQSWAKVSTEEHKTLPKDLQNVKPLGLCVREEAYSVHVDIFAAEEGYMYFNTNLRMGRMLNNQELFNITEKDYESREAEHMAFQNGKSIRTSQCFNPADFFLGDRRFQDEAFDYRVEPALRCAEFDPSSGRWISKRNQTLPKSPDELLGQLKGSFQDFKTMNTALMHQTGREQGCRSPSHLIAPEKKGFLASNLNLKNNMHVFMRPVGHQIVPHDRDSCILARLRLTLPEHYDELLRWTIPQGAELEADAEALEHFKGGTNGDRKRRKDLLMKQQESMVNFVVIKWNMDMPGTVVWVPYRGDEDTNCLHCNEKFHTDSKHCGKCHKSRDVCCWAEAGETLMAIRLDDGNRTVVSVVVPSFDLRFRRETGWYLRKTLLDRWRTLEKRIERNARMKSLEQGPSSGATAAIDGEGAEKGRRKGKDDIEEPINLGPDGYSKPIFVSLHAFVCRIRKRTNSHNFDRPRTKNWYRKVLQDVFPEVYTSVPMEAQGKKVGGQQIDDEKRVKDYFFSRFMNLRHPLVKGENHANVGVVKGHITIVRQKNDGPIEKADSQPQELNKPQDGLRPIQNLWCQSGVDVNVYVLTARNINKAKIGVNDRLRLYLTCEILGGSDSRQTSHFVDTETNGADFYHHFPLTTRLPGATTLILKVWQKQDMLLGSMLDKLIGEVSIDLEDRNLLLMQRKLRATSNPKYIKSRVCPRNTCRAQRVQLTDPKSRKSTGGSEDIEGQGARLWIPPKDPVVTTVANGNPNASTLEASGPKASSSAGSVLILPRMAPLQMLPIETKDLLLEDEETGNQDKVGSIRFWVDITPDSDIYAPAILNNKCIDLEVRVTIWCVTNISIFKDFGQRNDAFVKGRLRAKRADGREMIEVVQTDVHKWARFEANFNWMWVFKVQAPAAACSLELALFDADRISASDPIYEAKVLNLDHIVGLAYANVLEGRPQLGVDSRTMVFDSWPKQEEEPHLFGIVKEAAKKKEKVEPTRCLWWRKCCYRICPQRRLGKPKPCYMKLDLQVLPLDEAARDPVNGHSFQLSEPKGRVGMGMLVQSPMKIFDLVLGPANVRIMKISACVLIVVLILLTFLLISYYLANTYLQPFLR